ncbi:MAG: hypothetical protein HC906_02690 [Bacteroidales bacterium]|nr:hypothetical protein [Bacteroidales bacterium]
MITGKDHNKGTIGGILGAFLGILLSVKSHKKDEKPVQKAGKTALFAGSGFLIGHWVEKPFRKFN